MVLVVLILEIPAYRETGLAYKSGFGCPADLFLPLNKIDIMVLT